MTNDEPSEAAKQYVRDLMARDHAWAELDGEGLPEPIIEFSYHCLMEAFDAGREATESRALDLPAILSEQGRVEAAAIPAPSSPA